MPSIAMKLSAFVAIAAASGADASAQVNMTVESSGPWQLYTFAQSWQPEFCHGQSYPGCSTPDDFWTQSLTIHGLWPDVTAGQYPSDCSDEAFDINAATSGVSIDMLEKYWPNVKASTDSSSYTSFWSHEWTTHGTCSGLDQATYFQTAINMLVNNPTPSIIASNYGSSVSADDLRAAYGGDTSVILQCSGRYLKQVLTCWAKDDNNVPTAPQPCPGNLLNEDNCSGSIRISTF
jgi:ribonuclease T2